MNSVFIVLNQFIEFKFSTWHVKRIVNSLHSSNIKLLYPNTEITVFNTWVINLVNCN